jgi:hypothetical protein
MTRLVLLLTISHLMITLAQGTTYYVANTGTDTNSGLDAGHPWGHAPGMTACASVCATTTLQPGDSVLMNRGDTWRDILTTDASGTAASPINFGAYGSGPNPVISGADVISSWVSENENAFVAYYSAAIPNQPGNVLVDASNRLALNTNSKTSLVPGQWFWDSTTGRVYARLAGDSNPASHVVEGTQRSFGIDNTKAYHTFSNISVYGVTSVGYYEDGGANTVTSNVSSTWNDDIGMLVRGAFPIYNNPTASHNLGYGIAIGNITTSAQGVTLNNPTTQFNVHSGIEIDQTVGVTVNGGDSSFNGNGTIEGNGMDVSSTGGINAQNIAINNFNGHDNRGNGFDAVGNGANGAVNIVIAGGSYYNNTGGPDLCSGIRLDTNTNQSRVQYVRSYNNQSGGIVVEDHAHDNQILYNLVYGNARGITHSNGTGANVLYYGNIAYGNSIAGMQIASENAPATVKNNIFMNNSTYGIITDDGNTDAIDYNDIYGNGTNYSGISKPPHDINADPEFLNAVGADFRIGASSPVIHAGANLGSPYNLALDPRTTSPPFATVNQSSIGGGWNIGAFVYMPGITPLPTAPTNLKASVH